MRRRWRARRRRRRRTSPWPRRTPSTTTCRDARRSTSACRRSTPTISSTSSVAAPIHVCTPVPGVISTTRTMIARAKTHAVNRLAEDRRQATPSGDGGPRRADEQCVDEDQEPDGEAGPGDLVQDARADQRHRSRRLLDRVGSFDRVGDVARRRTGAPPTGRQRTDRDRQPDVAQRGAAIAGDEHRRRRTARSRR